MFTLEGILTFLILLLCFSLTNQNKSSKDTQEKMIHLSKIYLHFRFKLPSAMNDTSYLNIESDENI